MMDAISVEFDEKALSKVIKDGDTEASGGPALTSSNRSKWVRDKITKLRDSVEDAYWSLGRLLYEVFYKEYWKVWQFESFEAYVGGELKFKKRKAQYLMTIWKRFRIDKGIEAEQLRGLGWSRANQVVRMIDNDTPKQVVVKLIEQAKEKTVVELEGMARKKDSGDDKVETLTRKTFVLFEGQLRNINDALMRAGKITGSDKQGHQLDVICLEWNATHMAKGEKDALEQILASVNRCFNVQVIALKDKKEADRLLALLEKD